MTFSRNKRKKERRKFHDLYVQLAAMMKNTGEFPGWPSDLIKNWSKK